MAISWRSLLSVLFLAAACSGEPAPGPDLAAPAAQAGAAAGSAAGPSTGATSIPASRWQAVLIAGDNNSPAFDNGVEALRDKLSARGVADIRVLTSDPGANPGVPVATANNVSMALRGAAGDACLAFITSHGDERGVALRQARGFVSPAALNRALEAGCGQRPTVVIVSACHSGVFLDPAMRQPNRIVLAAAAADRVSFGCGSGDQYTYYDQCLLQQFDGAATWQQLAVATRRCVEGLEKSLGVPRPSQPQLFVGAAVAGLAIPGR